MFMFCGRSIGALLRSCFGTLVTVTLLVTQVQGAALNWNNAAGGAASTAANWLPAQIPAAADDLTFNLVATYTTSFNSAVTASHTHTYKRGTVTLNMINAHTASAGVVIGDLNGDIATVTLTTGTLTSNASAFVGDAAGSAGTLNVNDDDAEFVVGNGGDLVVGNNGAATLNITGTGRVEVADQFIAGSNSTSVPAVAISGSILSPPFSVSTLDVLGAGESRIGAGGDATMTISNGALARFAGDVIVANGSASNSSVTVEVAGLLNARLAVGGDLLIGRNSSVTAAGIGTVNLNTGGTVSVDGSTFLGDPNGGTGTLDMGGGTFGGDVGINVLAGSTIEGNGTINADINNSGTIHPSGGTGLTINGVLFNTTNNINGNKIHFGADGGYDGSGICLADITGDANSSIIATGTLSMGANTTSGFFYLGTLDVGSHSVTLLDSNQAVLGGETLLDAGTLSCSTGIGNQNGAAVRGKGTLNGNVVNSGIIEPTDPGDAPVQINIDGNLTLNPTSRVQIELNGPGNTDRVVVDGTVSFGGTASLTIGPDYLPSIGEQMILVNAVGGRSGTFPTLEHTPICDQYTIVLVYSSTAGIALVRPSVAVTSVGDVDRDGDHDLEDLGVWVPCLAGPDVLNPPAGCDPQDFHFRMDIDGPACEDYDVDLKDFWVLQRILGD